MADIQKSVEIIFGAVDNTGDGLSNVSKSLGSVVDNASNITEPLAKVAEFALKAETAVLALAATYGGYAMAKAAEFETAQIDLNKVLSDADPAIGSFTDTVIRLSEQYGVSSAQVLQGIANFKQAGFTAAEAADLQKNALDLMIAGDIDAAEASQVLISSIKGFGVEASSASRFIEALNNVSNDYATDVQQLAAGMARVAPIAKAMGFSFEETTGLLTPMIEIFGSGEQAAEGLKTGLLKLTDDANPVREALESIGVSQFDLNGKMRSGKDIFYDVANAFSKLDENQKAYLTQQLVGIDQAPRMVLAFNNIAKIQEVTQAALAQTGSVMKEVDLRLDSTTKKADIFKASFDNLAIGIGAGLNAQFGDIVSGSTDVVQALEKIVKAGGLDGFFAALKPLVADFSTTLENIAKNLPAAFAQVDFSGLLESFRDLGGEIGGIFDGLDLNTPEGLAKAIQFVVDSLESLTIVVSGVVDEWTPLVRTFIEGIDASNKLTDSTKKAAGEWAGFGQVFETFKGILTGGFDAIDTIGKALTAIAGIKAAETIIGFSGALKTIEAGGAIAGLEKMAVALAGFAAANPIAALAVAVAGLNFAIDSADQGFNDYIDTQRTLRESSESLAENQGKITARLSEISQRTGVTVGSMDDLNRAVDEGRLVFNDATGAYEKAGAGVRDYDAEVQAASDSGGWFADAVNAVSKSLISGKEAATGAAQGFKTLGEAQQYVAENMAADNNAHIVLEGGLWKIKGAAEAAAIVTRELGDTSKTAAAKAAEGSADWKRVQEVMIESQKVANDYQIKLGELSNKRYEIAVKASVDLQTAEIEAETARIGQAFNSLTETIGTFTTGATDLWGLFEKKAGFSGANQLEEAALRMEQRLDKELDLKEQLTRAIVEQAQSMTERLNSGQALIQIDGGDLSPELEMIFDKILKYTQTRTTQEGLALLLGV